MGTSQSAPGPLAHSSLVPSWADDKPTEPIPTSPPRRFAEFRKGINKFIDTGKVSDLNRALRYYSKTTTAGGEIAARRLGNVTKTGAGLFEFLNGEASIDNIDLNELSGMPSEQAIAIISNALSLSVKGDSEIIKKAISDALAEALSGIEVFDPDKITDDILILTLINYLATSIFLQIVMDADAKWSEIEKPSDAVKAEIALKELVRAVVDKHMSKKVANNIRKFSHSEMKEIERDTIIEVWNEWEVNND